MSARKKKASAPAAPVVESAPRQHRIEYEDLDELLKRKHPDNAKAHDAALLDEMIADNGFVGPPLVDERSGLLAFGHGRLDDLAAKKAAGAAVPAGVEDRDGRWFVPVIRGVSFASDEALLKYLVGDNRAVERGGWDNKKLVEALSRIGKENLRSTGFDQSELVTFLARMRSTERKADPDAEAPVPPKKAVAKRGQVWQLGDHRLLCGDSTVEADVKKLMGDSRAVLMATDPPYGVDYTDDVRVAAERAHGRPQRKQKWNVSIDNDEKTGADIQPFLEAAFRTAAAHALIEKAAWYLWHAQMTQGFFAAAAAAAVQIHRQIVWVKPSLLFGFGDYHWRHELCQPPGTMVRVPAENKRGGFKQLLIESLSTGDVVLAYDRYSKAIRGKRAGVPVKVGARHYTGEMYSVTVGGKTTRATDGHLWSARLAPAATATWAVYLMRFENWWRVGISKVLAPYGCGVKSRAKGEHADATWILSTHGTKLEAICAEQVASVKYGIPTTHWRTNEKLTIRTAAHVRRIYEALDLSVMRAGALRALADHGRLEQYPLLEPAGYRDKVSRRASMIVRSCNLVAGVMALPVPHATGDDATWTPIETITHAAYAGPVYSLEVERFHHYVADGIVTHNCFYGWVKGHRPPFYGQRNQTTVWEMGNETSPAAREHPTQKPVRLFEIPMENHTKGGEVCYEPFSGSGSQIIAGEKLGRRVFAIEIDPRYVDVAVQRWETYTSKRARKLAG